MTRAKDISKILTDADISGNIDVDGVTNLDVVDIDGALTQDGGAVFNEGGADVDFRVESDNLANALFVQGSDGAVGIGTNVPASKLDLYTATASGFNYPLFLSANNADAAKRNYVQLGFSVQQSATGSETGGFDLKALRNNSAVYLANYGGAAGAAKWQFYTEGTERVRIHTNGVLSASDGIALGVGTANTASNVLDDYEEGTFTPNFALGGSGNGLTYGNEAGSYTKVGNRVHTSGIVQLTGKNNAAIGSGAVTITGLPFTVTNNNNAYAAAGLRMQNISFADSPSLATIINTTTADLREITNAGTVTTLTDGNIAANSYVIFSLSYKTDA